MLDAPFLSGFSLLNIKEEGAVGTLGWGGSRFLGSAPMLWHLRKTGRCSTLQTPIYCLWINRFLNFDSLPSAQSWLSTTSSNAHIENNSHSFWEKILDSISSYITTSTPQSRVIFMTKKMRIIITPKSDCFADGILRLGAPLKLQIWTLSKTNRERRVRFSIFKFQFFLLKF